MTDWIQNYLGTISAQIIGSKMFTPYDFHLVVLLYQEILFGNITLFRQLAIIELFE